MARVERRKQRLPFFKEWRKQPYFYSYEIGYLADQLGISRAELERRINEQNSGDAGDVTKG